MCATVLFSQTLFIVLCKCQLARCSAFKSGASFSNYHKFIFTYSSELEDS